MQNAQPTPQERIFPIVIGFWHARALAVATELGLAELLAERPQDVDQLASPRSLSFLSFACSLHVASSSTENPRWPTMQQRHG